ncbi:hypothetical protein LY76DRAFT_355518 [Colletotrichum caudatum]|nr:hypothetical protein LY76DRAFT_355518 [Colletotrichum caudatum]
MKRRSEPKMIEQREPANSATKTAPRCNSPNILGRYGRAALQRHLDVGDEREWVVWCLESLVICGIWVGTLEYFTLRVRWVATHLGTDY